MYDQQIIQLCKEIVKISNKYNINTNAKQYKEIIFKSTEKFPENISLSKRTLAIANNNSCECKYCNEVHGNYDKEYCSHTCYIEDKKKNAQSNEFIQNRIVTTAIEKGELNFKNKIENDDYLVCKICGCKTGNIVNHIRMHKIKLIDYKRQFNVIQIKTNNQIKAMQGENNPAYQHGGRLSPYSDKFIYAETTNKKELVDKLIKTRTENGNNTTSLPYWLKKANGDIELAKELLNDRQVTFSKTKCIERHGEEKGLQVWLDRQEKWQDTLNSFTNEQKSIINKKKSTKINYSKLWNNIDLHDNGIIYLLKIEDNLYKIGVTSKELTQRYSRDLLNTIEIVLVLYSNIGHCFCNEQLIKNEFDEFVINKDEAIQHFGWTETFRVNDITPIIDKIKYYHIDEEITKQIFINTFKVNQ